jgi:antitoxin HicB
MQYAYPARPKDYANETVVRFRDLPEAIAGGANRAEALLIAEGVLEAALWFRLKEGQDIPAPSGARRGDVMVPVKPGMAAKVAFASAFRASRLSQSELARRLKIDAKEVRRMLDPKHATKIEKLDEGIRALGRRLIVGELAA